MGGVSSFYKRDHIEHLLNAKTAKDRAELHAKIFNAAIPDDRVGEAVNKKRLLGPMGPTVPGKSWGVAMHVACAAHQEPRASLEKQGRLRRRRGLRAGHIDPARWERVIT